MVSAFEIFAAASYMLSVVSLVLEAWLEVFTNLYFFVYCYGAVGLIVWVFGSTEIWKIQQQVLLSQGEKVAMDFKVSMQNESNMIAVAGTIVAQIAITALSLASLSQVHWVARAFFTFSLVSSIMAVYYASDQYRILGRHLQGDDVRRWIRNYKLGDKSHKTKRAKPLPRFPIEFLPSAPAVLTISAPNVLLSSSLNAFLLGLGVYLGQIWTRHLDESAGVTASRAVFITYAVSVAVCYGVYALSSVGVVRPNLLKDVLKGIQAFDPSTTRRVPSNSRNEGESPSQQNKPSAAVNVSKERSAENPTSSIHPTSDNPQDLEAQTSISLEPGFHAELIQALRDAAQQHRDSAAADEHLAQLYESLAQNS